MSSDEKYQHNVNPLAVTARLNFLMAVLNRCERDHNPRLADKARNAAAKELSLRVNESIHDHGITPVMTLMEEVDFRGW